MIHIHVKIRFESGETTHCGDILCEAPSDSGFIRGDFRYDAEYLNHPSAFPIDPVSLPLKDQVFQSSRPTGVFGVFEDSLPDDWGRQLLVKKHKLSRKNQHPPGLLMALGANGLGALSYQSNKTYQTEKNASVLELETLLDAAEKYESGSYSEDDEINILLRAGSSPGGARPKVLVKDKKNTHWLVKFPSIKDRYAIVPIEFATMMVAQKAGIQIPELKLSACGRKRVLFVKRFDVWGKNGRHHMISLQTLLKADNWYNLSYRDIVDVLRKYSCQPEIDLEQLYRQMVLNAYIGNTDDHLKNFSMLHTVNGFCLSPAYDIIPDVNENRSHVLNFEFDPTFPGKNLLLTLGKKAFGISDVKKIHDNVRDAVETWKDVFLENDVPGNDIERLSPNIDKHFV